MLKEESLQSLDPRIIKQVENAMRALEKNNAHYAVDICTGILSRFPACVDVRSLLRRAQRKAKAKKSIGSLLSSVTTAPFMLKPANYVDKEPTVAFDELEKIISQDPRNTSAHRVLGKVAEHHEMWGTAALAYNEIRDIQPNNIDNLLELGQVLLKAGKVDDAIRIGDEALKKDPACSEAQDLIKQAAVSNTVSEGNWESEGDYRSKLKDEGEAAALEQDARVVNDEDSLKQMVERSLELVESEPDNLNHYKALAAAYEKLDDLDGALNAIRRARSLPAGEVDNTLEGLEDKFTKQVLQLEIDEVSEQLEANPEDASLQERLQSLQEQSADYEMARAMDLVDRFPNDHQYRFDLGVLLYGVTKYREAIKHFQVAQQGAKVRANALLYLGCSLMADNKVDMAAEQLQIAKNEIGEMNEIKKEIIYYLGDAYNRLGKPDAAIAEFKVLYSADIGFKDVADKIDEYYANH